MKQRVRRIVAGAVLLFAAMGLFAGSASAEIKLGIVDAFRARKIEIPFPQREVRVLGPATLASYASGESRGAGLP